MRLFVKFLIGFVLVFGSFYVVYDMTGDGKLQELPFEIVSQANIEEYYVYGTSLNLKGNVTLDYEYTDMILLLYDALSGNEKSIPLISKKTDEKTEFYLTEEINNGFSLEELERSNYYVFLQIIVSEEDSRYYRLENTTSYDNIIYYTLSKTGNKVIFTSDERYDTFYMKVSKNKNSDVYDIVLDAGHGG